MAPFSKEDKILIKILYECKGYTLAVYNRVSELRLDEQQHQQAAGEVEKVRNSVTHDFRHFRWCSLGRILNKYKKLSYCCDSRSYCMQYLTLFIVSTTSRPLNKKSCQSANPINNYCKFAVRTPLCTCSRQLGTSLGVGTAPNGTVLLLTSRLDSTRSARTR